MEAYLERGKKVPGRGKSPVKGKNKAGKAWRELGRQMAFNPSAYGVFANLEGKLPKVKPPKYYIEGTVEIGTAQGTGQYRVVCLVNKVNGKLKVIKKYWTQTHYGTGSDAGKKPAFRPF